jgi:hypothetical protein
MIGSLVMWVMLGHRRAALGSFYGKANKETLIKVGTPTNLKLRGN